MRRNAGILAALALLISMIAATQPGRAGDPAVEGLWLGPFSEDGPDAGTTGDFNADRPRSAPESARFPTAVSAAALRDGRVLYFNGVEGSEAATISIALQMPDPENSRSRVLDLASYFATGDPPAAAAVTIPDPEDGGGGDLFCTDLVHLADGRVIAVGGSDWANDDEALGLPEDLGRTELYGRKNVRVFDPITNEWTQMADMHFPRWYPTLVTLPDGKLFVASGTQRLVYNSSAAPGYRPPGNLLPQNVHETETYDLATDTWTVNDDDPNDDVVSGATELPLFARLHMLPNGRVLYDATGQMWSPAGGDQEQAEWSFHKWYDPATRTWEKLDPAPLGARSGVFSVMLPLRPPYDTARILIGGGTLGTTPGSYLSNSLSEILTWSDDPAGEPAAPGAISRELGPMLNNVRWYSSGVVLPTGEVIALSGADRDEVIDPGSEFPVRQAEMYDPQADEWIPLASAKRDRTYHNTAILLRDGSILVGGHSPIAEHYGSHQENPPPFANNFKDPSFEIFRPPYLFRGLRPGLQTVPEEIHRGTTFAITTRPGTAATDPTIKVVLARLPAATHVTDADQRTVELKVVSAQGSSLVLEVPSSAAVLPAGPYYLFMLRTNQGFSSPTASIGHVVSVLP